MADRPVPDDRELAAALPKLKAYNNYKARQTQSPPTGGGDSDLSTVETWANDAGDTGAGWGQKKQQESNQKIKNAGAWRERTAQDDKEAAAEQDFHAKFDSKKFKDDLKKKMDDYNTALKGLADAGEPGFKGKAAETKGQTADAKKFLDEKFDKSIKEASQRNAQSRQDRKAIAGEMQKKGDEGKQWQQQFGDQPGKFPAGQSADVQAALDRLSAKAAGLIEDIQPFGARAAPHVQALQGVQAWADKLKPQVGSEGAALKAAKEQGKSGAAQARTTFANVDAFEGTLEGEGNENLDTFRRWTDENNRLAKEWSNSPSPKHRAWAQAWLKNQGD